MSKVKFVSMPLKRKYKDEKMKLIRNNKGFTLIELLAVLIILGVIIGIAVPRMMSFDKSAESINTNYENVAVERKTIYENYIKEKK